LYLLYLRFVRRLCTVADASTEIFKSMGNSYRSTLLAGQLCLLAASLFLLGLFKSLTLSLALSMIYWFLLETMQYRGNDAAIVLVRGYVLAAVLLLVNDAMAMGCWLAFYAFSWPLALLMATRTVTILALIFVAQLGAPPDQGIFEHTLGYTTLQPMRALANHPWLSKVVDTIGAESIELVPADDDVEANNRKDWSVFAGSGQRLGGGPGNDRDENKRGAQSRHEVSRLV